MTTRFGYAGDALIAEYDGSNNLLRRYVHGAGADEPLVWYEKKPDGTFDRKWLHADERGSVIAVSADDRTKLAINTYDEYGIPGSDNLGRFQYTGQAWIPELGLYHYKARTYSATLGRFLQPDPIGYGDGMNMYAYVGNDPLNGRDPTGMIGFEKDIIVPMPDFACPEGMVPFQHVRGACITIGPPPQQEPLFAGDAVDAASQAQPGDGQRACPTPPSPGPGRAVLDKNIRDAAADRPRSRAGPQNGGVINLYRLGQRVTSDQNYKVQPKYRGSAPFGNFNFGATAQARGFTLKETLAYSDQFQWMTTGRHDPAEDIADVTNGYNYAARGCYQR